MKIKLISTIRFFKSKIKSVWEMLTISFQLVFSDDDCYDGYGDGGAVVMVPHVPDEIVIDILCRLPAEKVVECRTVCKHWNALSSTPYFATKHLKAADSRDPSIIIRYERNEEPFVFLFSQWGSVTRNSTDGGFKRLDLQLIENELTYNNRSWRMRSYDEHGVLNFVRDKFIYVPGSTHRTHSSILYNPLTRQKLVLHTAMGYVCAFFHHPAADEYRVLWYRTTLYYVQYQILCLGLSSPVHKPSWRRLKDFHLAPINYRVVRIRNLESDVLHWVSTAMDGKIHCDTYMLMFDVNKEEFSSMPHPGGLCHPAFCDHRHSVMFHLELKSGDGSSLLCVCDVSEQDRIDMWVLEDYQKQIWVKRHKIVLNLKIYRSEDIYDHEKAILPLGIVNGEMIILMNRLGVFAYNLSTGTLRRIIKILDGSIGFQNRSDFVTHGSLIQTSLVSFTDFRGHHLAMDELNYSADSR